MGGDLAPAAVIAGAVQAVRRHAVRVSLVGTAAGIRSELSGLGAIDPSTLAVVDAPDVVAMDEPPLAALRRKPRASIRVAADLVARGEAQALFSAGHTGATFLAARAALGVLAGVDRPALAVTVPTRTGAAILLDVGANPECRPRHLSQFGVIGAAYAQVALGVDRPRVGLLSIGEEAGKGTGLIRDAHALLQRTALDYIGNVEARDVFSGRADVIVCDGFTGNIALKIGEGLVEAAELMLREELGAELVTQIGALLTRRALQRFKQRVDYAEKGGAPLLGIDGVVVIGHGRSTPQAVENGIALAARLAGQGVVSRLAAAMGREA
jgi:glycerol-3-phosphate acyltransferase PlsX